MFAKINFSWLVALCFCVLVSSAEVRAQESRLILITGASTVRAQQMDQVEKPGEEPQAEELTDQSPPNPNRTKSDVQSLLDSDTEDLDDMDDLDDFDDEPPIRPVTQWNLKPMTSLRAGLSSTSTKIPSDQSHQLTTRPMQPLAASEKLFAWAAPELRYQPLLFEDVALERYGQTRGMYKQPFFSAAHYLKSAFFLPLNSMYEPLDTCDYPLGYCRPGDPVPCVKQSVRLRGPRR